MNIERVYPIWLLVCASAGVALGIVTGEGAIQGLIAGMLIAVLPLLLLGLTYPLLMLWRPSLPICRCRECNYKGYKYVRSSDGLHVGSSVRFRCPRCGRVYELSRDRFNELANDGHTIPYMQHTKWGRWKEIKAEQASADDVTRRAAPEE
jgi:uncharacterized C2H2 Zn-finger protein